MEYTSNYYLPVARTLNSAGLYVAVVFAKRGKFQFEEIYEFGNVIKN
jgi:hypothetical protein